MINIGIIGCGHWGPNYIRVFSQLPDTKVLMAADLDAERLKRIKELYPHVELTSQYMEILKNPVIDAVCIATPTVTHFSLTQEALKHNKHVLCEKPLTLKAKECLELKQLSLEKKKNLMVGHVFLFNAGIVWLKDYLKSQQLGKVFYAYSTRTNLGPFRYDVNAFWDLAPHDISIFNFLFGGCPLNVSARGHQCLDRPLEDIAFCSLEYPQNIMVNLHVSWLDPKKVRQITIVGSQKMAVWNDLDSEGPIKVYDKHVERTEVFYKTYGEFHLLSREGNITIPKINSEEPLKVQCQYFIECLKGKSFTTLADAEKAFDVLKTLEAVERSMGEKGACVQVDSCQDQPGLEKKDLKLHV